MLLSNVEIQRRWRARHPGLNAQRVTESRKRHWERHVAWMREYCRERYHRIQDEAGCHMAVNNFYPGFRLLKALMEAEVVEIK